MKGSNYWQKRFQAVEDMNNRTAKATVQSITPAFDEAQAQIEKEINAWYARVAKNNNISLLEAKKLLNAKELKEFKWDVQEYIKYGRQNALDQKWMKELENASARFHISRLEALKVRTQHQVEKAFGNELDALDQMSARIYTDDYYHTAYEIQKGIGVGWDVGQIDQKKLDKIISKPWTTDKRTFSDRIWTSKTQLVDSLHKELTQMCMLGKAPDKAINNIAKRMNVSKGQAGRLVMTEATYFGSVAQKDCFNDLDVEKFEIVATLDSHTSDICQQMDGKVFDMKDFEAGVTAPPFHVWCRSCTCPWFEDNDDGTRFARDADGKTYQVPANMKYQDWMDHFVLKTKDPDKWLKPSNLGDIVEAGKEVKKIRQAINLEPDMFPRSFTATKAEAKNTQALMDYVNACEDADPAVVELYSKMRKMENIESQGVEWAVKHNKNSEVKYWYNWKGELTKAHISYPKLTLDNPTGQVNTTLHEQMHLMDMYFRKDPKKGQNWLTSGHGKLKQFFRDIDTNNVKMSPKVEKLFSDFKDEYHKITTEIAKSKSKQLSDLRDSYYAKTIDYKEYKKRYSQIEKAHDEMYSWHTRNVCGGGVDCFQDIYDAISGGTFRNNGTVIYGHGKNYYTSTEDRCAETLANYGALSITRPELIDLLREDYPDLVDMLNDTIQEMLKKVGN